MLAYTPTIAKKLWPHAKPEIIQGISASSFRVLAKYGITQLRDLIDFTCEISEETGGMMALVENLHYSAIRASQVWPSRFPTPEYAAPYVADPVKLADRVYGGRMGNGASNDDGYNFRGRGAIQLTGRDWYSKIGAETGLDLINNPDLVASPDHVLECAAAFWKLDGVSALANAGEFNAEVKRINGGYTNMAARLAWRETCTKILLPELVTFTDDPNAAPTSVPAPAVVQAQITAVHEQIKTLPPHLPLLDELIALWEKYI